MSHLNMKFTLHEGKDWETIVQCGEKDRGLDGVEKTRNRDGCMCRRWVVGNKTRKEGAEKRTRLFENL